MHSTRFDVHLSSYNPNSTVFPRVGGIMSVPLPIEWTTSDFQFERSVESGDAVVIELTPNISIGVRFEYIG